MFIPGWILVVFIFILIDYFLQKRNVSILEKERDSLMMKLSPYLIKEEREKADKELFAMEEEMFKDVKNSKTKKKKK
ncbi:MAG: hypothetical protein COU63_02920 [Candidatus Pacebacteria bacterium CG10_big_fil_rev_8_21_14_0_10_36_11]|nr:hypothetical protein [Candidatus Pacearchaeota archaeon]OIP74382.1 MAG: hypothetical protein AUK08_01180 [Candidatus Pacebacteria bacterium CG2_30_36_39]PIR64945.1 MAG: hypothetical protein COU63_02920 [Candidatus Pacebacteria bacterium CG10_big_fil_rev_8_21_14_0_10_36_11]PJC43035.1 MAG: hypothetical protein CO040_01300 [Candidatus Pacebacteria bacterium CG_4_9_14_0_2_um_filter_36_8]